MGAYIFSEQGRQRLNEFLTNLHTQLGVPAGSEFAVTPMILQTLFEKAVEDGSWFLNMINANVMVPDLKGDKLGMFITALTSTRTDTSGDLERKARHLHDLDPHGYELFPTENNFALTYKIIDQWKHIKNGREYAEMYAKLLRLAVANDSIKVGWHGTSAAATTDPVANPLGQDLNVGWLQLLRNHASERIEETGATFGAGGDFANLDALVADALQTIPEHFRYDPGLRVLISDDILSSANAKFYEAAGDTPSEKHHMDGGRILETYGGKRAIAAPFMPAGSIVITNPKNLSIYRQEGSWRRQIIDNPKKNQLEDFNSHNSGYVVEEYDAITAITNIAPAPAG